MVTLASREFELELLQKYDLVAGVDEVGRGCLAGPVYVCVAVIDKSVKDCAVALADSKKLTFKKRIEYFDTVANWVLAYEIGISTNEEIDLYGINTALKMAGNRAICKLYKANIKPDIFILDGKYNWLCPETDLFSESNQFLTNSEHFCENSMNVKETKNINVITKIKADEKVSVVAAASILAKVTRDRYMIALKDDKYDFSNNKGYSSPKHIAGLKKYGLGKLHRKSWKMPMV